MKADTAVQCYQLLSSGAIIVYYFNSTQLGTTTRVLLQYLGCYKSAIFKHVVTTVLYYFSTSGTTSWSYSILGTTSGCYFNVFGTGGVIRASGVPRGDVYICDGVNFFVGYV